MTSNGGVATSCDREAQFLASRAERLGHSGGQASSRNEEFQLFWSRARQEISSWTQRVENLRLEGSTHVDSSDKDNDTTEQSTKDSTHRVQLREDLAQLKSDLETLRKHCLSHESSSYDGWTVPEELPLTDLRLLHNEFTKCSALLETARKNLLPKAKFIFQRYRQAKKQQQLQNAQNEKPGPATTTSAPASKSDATKNLAPKITENSLENLLGAFVQVDPHGHVKVETSNEGETDSVPPIPAEASLVSAVGDAASSWVVRHVSHSKISLDMRMKELHISHVSDSIIWACGTPIAGALHITGCSNVQLHVHSFHQLRIHECNNFQCHVQQPASSGGAIMEDCTNMTFYIMSQSTADNSAFEVKDFNWLRNGIPSPNFRIVVKALDNDTANTHLSSCQSKDVPGGLVGVPAVAVVSAETENENSAAPVTTDAESDDEDEL